MKVYISIVIAAGAVLGGCSKNETPEHRLVNQIQPASGVTPASGAAPTSKGAEKVLIDQIKRKEQTK